MAYEAAFIDMDGTLYRDGNPIDGAADAVQWLRENGIMPLFFTNNATLHRETYVKRLADCGIEAERDEIVTSGYLTARHLAETAPDETVYVVGEDGFRDELAEQEITVTDDTAEADTFVLSYTRDIDYDLLTEVLRGFEDQRLVATNPDQTLPTDDGQLPGTGTIVAAVETMLGREADIIGKPSLTAARTAAGIVDVDLENCLMIGDRLNTDIEMGQEAGMRTILVLSGVTDRGILAEGTVDPDHVLETIGQLPDLLYQKL